MKQYSLEEIQRKMLEDRRRFMTVIEDKYPRIYCRIMDGWGTRQLHEDLVRMLITDTTGRQGFPKEIGDALMQIHMIHQIMFNFEDFKLEFKDSFNPIKQDKW